MTAIVRSAQRVANFVAIFFGLCALASAALFAAS
jgi:hypothetical protein